MIFDFMYGSLDKLDNFFAAVLVFVGFFLLLRAFQWSLFKFLHNVAKHTKTTWDDKLLEQLKRPAHWFFDFVAVWFGLLQIPFGEYTTTVQRLLTSVFIIFIANFAIVFFNVIIHNFAKHVAKRTNSSIDDQLIDFLHKVMLTIIWVIAGVVILGVFDVEVGPILTSLGIAGLAIGLGLQDTLKNIFGGIALILDRNFKVGDIVKLQSGEEGEVREIGLRSTKIKTYDDEQVIIPNGQLANATINNIAQPDPKVRVTVLFGVAYGSDVKKVKEVVHGALKGIKMLEEPKAAVILLGMGDYALNFRAQFWTDDYHTRSDLRDQATEAIYNALNAAKISIPFPTTLVHLKKEAQE